jgi:hypothetical protein
MTNFPSHVVPAPLTLCQRAPSHGSHTHVMPAQERHPSEDWGWNPQQLDSRLRENDKTA